MPSHSSQPGQEKKDVEILIPESDVPYVRRVTDVDDLQRFFRRIALGELQDRLAQVEYASKLTLEDVADDYAQDIDGVRELINDNIVWGVYGQTGELVVVNHLHGNLEQLTSADAKNYKTLYMTGLVEVPQNFGETFEEVRDMSVNVFKARLEGMYSLGACFRFRDDKGNINKKLTGTGSVVHGAGTRTHIANFRTLYIDPAHRGRDITKLLTEARLRYVLENGFEKVHAKVTTTNREVIRSLRTIGFEPIKIEKNAARIERLNTLTGKKEPVYFDWLHLELDLQKLKAEQEIKRRSEPPPARATHVKRTRRGKR